MKTNHTMKRGKVKILTIFSGLKKKIKTDIKIFKFTTNLVKDFSTRSTSKSTDLEMQRVSISSTRKSTKKSGKMKKAPRNLVVSTWIAAFFGQK